MNLDTDTLAKMGAEWDRMLQFVDKYIHTFTKSRGHVRTPRIRFEALSVGSSLALRQEPDLIPLHVVDWMDSTEFKQEMRSDASNSKPKVIRRIEFVRDHLLAK